LITAKKGYYAHDNPLTARFYDSKQVLSIGEGPEYRPFCDLRSVSKAIRATECKEEMNIVPSPIESNSIQVAVGQGNTSKITEGPKLGPFPK